jgi:hypothetical protein
MHSGSHLLGVDHNGGTVADGNEPGSLTEAAICRTLLEIFQRPDTTFKLATFGDKSTASAVCTWAEDGSMVTALADPLHTGIIAAAVHEMLHRAMDDGVFAPFSRRVRESLIESMEAHLVKYINAHHTISGRWRRAITAKVRS